jgi:hypothetical protein
MGIGKGLLEVGLKEIPELFVSFWDTYVDSSHEDV